MIDPNQNGIEFMRLRHAALRGEALLRSGDAEEARKMLLPARQRLVDLLGGEPSWILGEIDDTLGRCAWQTGDFAAADAALASAIGQFAAATGAHSPSTERSRAHRAAALAAEKPEPDRISALVETRAALVAALGTDQRLPVRQLDSVIAALIDPAGSTLDAARRSAGSVRRLPVRTPSGDSFMGINGFN